MCSVGELRSSQVNDRSRWAQRLLRTPDHREWLGVLFLSLASVIFLILTWATQHPPGLMGVDESGYSLMAFQDWKMISQNGLAGIWEAMTSHGYHAPLVPMLAAPLTARNPLTTATVLVNVPFALLLIVSSFSLYKRVTTPRAALLGAAVTTFLPGVLTWARTVNFALPLTAVSTAALASLLASRRLTSWQWSILWGALTGLTLLTRFMALSLAPGLVLAAFVLGVGQRPWRAWIPNLTLGLFAATLVAAPWYAVNADALLNYLTEAGLSSTSPFYGETPPWQMRISQAVGQEILIPLTVVGCIIWALAVIQRNKTASVPMPRVVLAIGTTAMWYFVALCVSRNAGTGFTLPLVPLLIALTLWGAGYLNPWSRRVAAAAALALAVVNTVVAAVPLGRLEIGEYALVDGRSATDTQLMSALGQADRAVPDPVALGDALRTANCAIAQRGRKGMILNTRPDALISSVSQCAEVRYGLQPFFGSAGCGADEQTDTACVEEVIERYRFPTVVTGETRAPYPGYQPEKTVLPALADYRMAQKFDIAPGVTVRIWERNPPD